MKNIHALAFQQLYDLLLEIIHTSKHCFDIVLGSSFHQSLFCLPALEIHTNTFSGRSEETRRDYLV